MRGPDLLSLTLAGFLAIAAGCAGEVVPDRPAPDTALARAAAADDIREAVFRHLFGNNASAVQGKATAYFIGIADADPEEAFLARFADVGKPVRPASAAVTSPDGGVVDRETKIANGLLFDVTKITFEGDSRATLSASYYEAGLSAAGYDYVLERDGEVWKVVEQKMTWIS